MFDYPLLDELNLPTSRSKISWSLPSLFALFIERRAGLGTEKHSKMTGFGAQS